MGHITIGGHLGARYRHTIAAAFWIVVGMVAVIAFGDTLTLVAVALAVVTAAWWIWREVEHRVKSNDARRNVTGVDSRAGR
jgi:ABC-type nickel/cobalt efflux system permease component RcnA